MAIHYSLSMIMAWRIFKFCRSSVSSLDYFTLFIDTTSLVFSTTCSFYNTPIPHLILKGVARVRASEDESLVWRFFSSIVTARLALEGVLKGW